MQTIEHETWVQHELWAAMMAANMMKLAQQMHAVLPSKHNWSTDHRVGIMQYLIMQDSTSWCDKAQLIKKLAASQFCDLLNAWHVVLA